MVTRIRLVGLLQIGLVLCAARAEAQQPTATQQSDTSTAMVPTTKLEAFAPTAGTVITIGYDDLGSIRKFTGGSMLVEVREMRGGPETSPLVVRGLLVGVVGGTRSETAFIDEDELPELVRGIDALIATQTNPTSFAKFERRYTTKGKLTLAAYMDVQSGAIRYSITAGRVFRATIETLTTGDLEKFKKMIITAQQKLTSVPSR